MIAASARCTQNIAKFIQITGAANVGWTEAGCIAGNDPYPGTGACYTPPHRPYPIRTDRFYKPIWVEQDEEMYRQLDFTWRRILGYQERDSEEAHRRREEQVEIALMIEAAKKQPKQKTLGSFDIFGLDWDDTP